MNKLLILLLCFCGLPGISQTDFTVYHEIVISEMDRRFQMGHVIRPDQAIMHDGKGKLYYETPATSIESMQLTKPTNMVIRVSDLEGGHLQDIEIDYNDLDIDLSGFGNYYLGEQSFLVYMLGRYKFGLLNLINFETIGPIIPEVPGARSDAQDGSLMFGKVFGQGQYLLGYAWGMGLFCFNLMDLYDPFQIQAFCPPIEHETGNCLFIDVMSENSATGMFAQMTKKGSIDSVYYLFQEVPLELDHNQLVTNSIYQDRYLKLTEIQEDHLQAPYFVDLSNGRIMSDTEALWLMERWK